MLGKTTNTKSYKNEMFDTDIVITNFTINNNIINTKSNMTYNTWTMININSTIFTDRTITKPTILELKRIITIS